MDRPYLIRLSSTKGGVGKSVIAVNLAVALQMYGFKTLVVDMDTVNPCVGLYLGMQDSSVGTFDAMHSRAEIRRVIVPHPATGLHVLPGRISYNGKQPTVALGNAFFRKLRNSDYKFIIVDTQPGVAFPELLKWYDEALVVALPYEASCISAVKMFKKCGKEGLKASLVLNKVGNRRYELSIMEVEAMCETKVISTLPEDRDVDIGVAEHTPTYVLNKKAPFSAGIEDVTNVYSSRIDTMRNPNYARDGILSMIRRLFGRRA
jgi:MinD-like ATPase involved in chromosome partitioning or flagellar assembly